jgi:geranylgeranyl pyrophosphate synthase
MMAYSHGTRFKSEDYEMMKVLTDIAEKTMLFTNDYYSWAKEKICNNGRIMNVIDFFMRTEGMTECEALNKAKVCIVELEQTFLTAREDFYRSNPNLPVHIHKWAEVLGLVIAGYHYHCANFPRYDSVEIQNDRAYVEQNEVIANGGPKEKIQSEMTPTRQKSKNSNIGSFEPRNVLGPPNLLHFNDVENSDCLCTPEKPQQAIAKLDTSALTAPVQYIKSMSSKNVRSQLIDAFNVWFEVDSSTMATIKQVINDLHTSSLILDDIEDQSQLRRGGTTAHLVFGTAQSINSATHLFVRVSQMVYRLNKPALLDVLFEELETLFIGQSWDLSWRYESYCPTETEYLAMIDKKTGAMFRMLLRLMEVTTSRYSIQKFDSLITLLGRWFQIRDDYMNLQGVEYSKQKGFCEDLNEGKLSFPVVKCCDSSPINRKIILGIFRQNQYGSLPAESKSQILKLMKESGALMFTWKYIQTLESEVDSEIKYIETMTGEVNPTLRLLFKMLGNVPSPKVCQSTT